MAVPLSRRNLGAQTWAKVGSYRASPRDQASASSKISIDRWAVDVAEHTGNTGPRLLCAPRRIYLGDRPGEPGPHGQNWRPPRFELSISNRPDKSLGTHPVNWFPWSHSRVRLARLPNSGGISPLNWFPLEGQPCQVGEVAQLRRYLTAQLVLVPRDSHVQVGEVAQLRRYLTAQLVRAEVQHCPGWRGCPTPAVSPRSTGFSPRYSPVRLATLRKIQEKYLDDITWFQLR